MRKTFLHGVGGVISADIAVPEHPRELDFYSSILTTGDAPLWREDLMNNMGTPVIGLGPRTPEYESLPLQWMPHFQVADIAASVASALEMGGKVLLQSGPDDRQCQWAVLTDPDGAAFGMIPVVPEGPDPASQAQPIGCIGWLSLTTADARASTDFYQRVVGWNVVGWNVTSNQTTDREGHPASFEMLTDDGTAAAEINQHQGLPSVWLIHLPVDDLAESLRRVREGGGEVVKEYAEAGYAVVRDPVGVFLALQAASMCILGDAAKP